MTAYQARQKPRPPLRRCDTAAGGCGRQFRSWQPDRYCGRAACRQARLGAGELTEHEPKPQPAPVPYNEFPPGF